MYTEFIFGCELSKETPRECIEALDYSINGEEKKPKYEDPKDWNEEDFNRYYIERTLDVKTIREFVDKWDFNRLFHCCSYYFGAANPISRFYFDPTSDSYHISTRADLKNYSGQIEKFIEYIKPYVKHASGYPHGVFAYVQYEEAEFPTLYAMDGKYDVMDPEITKNVQERETRRWKVLGDLFKQIAPEYEITKEDCENHGKKPGEETYEDGWVWMVEYIMRKFKDQADMYEKGRQETEERIVNRACDVAEQLGMFKNNPDFDEEQLQHVFKQYIS